MNELPRELAFPEIDYHTPASTQMLEIRLVNRSIGSGDLLSPGDDRDRHALLKRDALEPRLAQMFAISNDSNHRRKIQLDRLSRKVCTDQCLVRPVLISKPEFS